MTKNELTKKICSRTSSVYNAKEVEEIIKSFGEVVVDTLKESNDKITFADLGAFSVKHIDERCGKSALTGKEWVKPAHDELVFKVAKKYKDM